MKPRAIDLFSGCGGLTLGLEQAGFRVVGAVEFDRLAAETYAANHKNVQLWQQDIRALSVHSVLKRLKLKPGQLDLLSGCPPCQGFSTITTLNGRNTRPDKRNDLVFEFLRFVRGMRPKTVMMENVPGLAKDRRIKKIVNSLEALGYQCNRGVLDAADFGVPQRRKRFILIAGHGSSIAFGKTSKRTASVRDALRNAPARSEYDALHNISEQRSPKIMRLIKQIPKDGGSRLDLGRRYQLACHLKCDGFKDVYGRMAWNEVAPTITGGCCNPSKGRFLHPTKDRAITLREAALLQTFPAKYIFSLRHGKFAAAQMIGNALPPLFVRHHARNILKFVTDPTPSRK
jgi:DNA (cytosine-5)-methyltransferase 1